MDINNNIICFWIQDTVRLSSPLSLSLSEAGGLVFLPLLGALGVGVGVGVGAGVGGFVVAGEEEMSKEM